MSVDVSPDGATVIFDLLGDLYSLPLVGGQAVPLTTGRAWDQAPRFSPDGTAVYFVSDRRGAKNIWCLTLADQSLQQITRSDADIMGTPNWTQDGRHLLVGLGAAETAYSESILHSIDPGSGEMTPIDAPNGPPFDFDNFERLRPLSNTYSGVQSSDGNVFFDEGQFDPTKRRSVVRLYRFDRKLEKRAVLTALDAPYSDYNPQLSHDGNFLAYFRQYDDRRTEIRLLDRLTGNNEALTELANADDASYGAIQDTTPNYAFTPDDRELIFWHGGKIHRVKVADGSSAIIPFSASIVRDVSVRAQPTVQRINEPGEAQIIRWPSASRDSQTMAFAAIGYVWVLDLNTGLVRRLTDTDGFEYMPALSPNGKLVAYISFSQSGDGYGSGCLMLADTSGGSPKKLICNLGETFLLPSWSADGQKIAVIRELETTSDVEAAFGWTLSAHGSFNEVALAPTSSDRLSIFVYSRSVRFDNVGQRLLFGYRRSNTETVLASARLDGSEFQTLAVGSAEVGGIDPAPDLKRLVLTVRNGTIWVVPFNANLEQQASTTAPGARQVGNSGGYYVDWNGSRGFTFAFGRQVFSFSLGAGEPEPLPIKIALDSPNSPRPTAFFGARLITMSDAGSERVVEPGTVVISDERIAAIGSVDDIDIPPGVLVIDVTGKTIMPGLLDTHYHGIGGRGFSGNALPDPSFNDLSAIAYGVTTAWEPGGAADDGVPATVDLQAAGRILGPRWSHSAMGAVGYPWGLLQTYSDALDAVEHRRMLGVDVLKEYNTPRREQRQWLSVAAHESGLGIVSHLQSFDGTMTRVVDGYTGGDHAYIPVPFYKDVHELLRQTGYIWTPNIVITSGSVGGYSEVRSYYWQQMLKKRPDELEKRAPITSTDRASQLVGSKPNVPYQIHRVRRVAEQAASAAAVGVHIGVSGHNMPASGLHQEMWYLWKGGMSIEDVLRAATLGNAEKLGLQEEIGSLEVGKMADFLILDENPLDDILNTLSIEYTVQGGVIYDADAAEHISAKELRRQLTSTEAANDDGVLELTTGTED